MRLCQTDNSNLNRGREDAVAFCSKLRNEMSAINEQQHNKTPQFGKDGKTVHLGFPPM